MRSRQLITQINNRSSKISLLSLISSVVNLGSISNSCEDIVKSEIGKNASKSSKTFYFTTRKSSKLQWSSAPVDSGIGDCERNFPKQKWISDSTHWTAQDGCRFHAGPARIQSNLCFDCLRSLLKHQTFQTLDELTDKVVPKKIKFDRDLQIDEPLSEWKMKNAMICRFYCDRCFYRSNDFHKLLITLTLIKPGFILV